MRKSAFSLIELMLSITIILILFLIAAPKLSFMDDYFLYREQDVLCATIAYVQHKAIATNQSQILSFDLNKNSYTYSYPKSKIQTDKLLHGVSFGFLSGTKGPPSKPEALVTKAITFDIKKEIPKIICLPNGAITSGTIYLLDKKKIKMIAVTIGITEIASIRKYAYEGNRWVML